MKTKVADYLVNFLGEKGIKDIFVVYGAANGDLIDGFVRTDKTRYVCVMHEQAGGFAAEGYAKISGKISAAIATSGPGGQNFVTPIGNCYYDSVPVLFITGQIKTKYMRPNNSIRQRGFQETPITEIVKPITKYSKIVKDPESIRYELEKAIYLAENGRPGPVLLDLPIDVQAAEIDTDSLVGFDSDELKEDFDIDFVEEKIEQFIIDLKNSKRPSILIGAGVRHAKAINELIELSSILKIPLFPTWNALDIVTSDNPYYGGRIGSYGGKGRNFGIQNSDLVLSIGSRISGRLFAANKQSFLRAAKKYLVDIDKPLCEKSNQEFVFDENIHCDAKLFLQKLIKKISNQDIPDFSEWRNKVIEWRNKYDPVKKEYFNQENIVNPYAFMRILSEEMNKGDIFLADCGGNLVIASQAFETKENQRFLSNNGNSPMGFSFSGTMGAYLASNKQNNVVCIIGDGGFNMNIQELQTIKTYNIGFKTFILNNHCYGITRQFQRTKFEGREEACGPKGYVPPNFVKICQAYGVQTEEISSISEAREKIKKVLSYNGPIVCDVNCHDWDTYEPRLFGGAAVEDMSPKLPKDEFLQNMLIEPLTK